MSTDTGGFLLQLLSQAVRTYLHDALMPRTFVYRIIVSGSITVNRHLCYEGAYAGVHEIAWVANLPYVTMLKPAPNAPLPFHAFNTARFQLVVPREMLLLRLLPIPLLRRLPVRLLVRLRLAVRLLSLTVRLRRAVRRRVRLLPVWLRRRIGRRNSGISRLRRLTVPLLLLLRRRGRRRIRCLRRLLLRRRVCRLLAVRLRLLAVRLRLAVRLLPVLRLRLRLLRPACRGRRGRRRRRCIRLLVLLRRWWRRRGLLAVARLPAVRRRRRGCMLRRGRRRRLTCKRPRRLQYRQNLSCFVGFNDKSTSDCSARAGWSLNTASSMPCAGRKG